MRSPCRGFSLIEILIAVSIIGILSTITIVSVTKIQGNTRDATKKAAILTLQTALQHYYADQHFYPYSPAGDVLTPPITNCTGRDTPPCTISKTYLNTLPNNLAASDFYYLNSPVGCDNNTTFCQNYCLYTQLENPGNSSRSVGSCNVPYTGRVNGVVYNYVVTQP